MPTVTMTLEEFEELRARAKPDNVSAPESVPQSGAAPLLREFAQHLTPPSAVVAQPDHDYTAARALTLSLAIVQYAVANLPPETNAGWPYKQLSDLGAILRVGVAEIAQIESGCFEIGTTFMAFAQEAESHELRREERAKIKPVRAQRSDFGPRLGAVEATRAHAVATGCEASIEDSGIGADVPTDSTTRSSIERSCDHPIYARIPGTTYQLAHCAACGKSLDDRGIFGPAKS